MQELLHVVYRQPFAIGYPQIYSRPMGMTVTELVRQADYLPVDFNQHGFVTIEGEVVPRHLWPICKPKVGTVVGFHAPIRGGGGGGGKQIIGLIAAIALTVVSAGIAGGALAPLLGTSFAAGTIGATLAAAAVSLAGALAIGALTSPPSVNPGQEDLKGAVAGRLEAASIDGNILDPNTPVPRVIGTRRVFPPFLGEPIVERVGQFDFVEAAFGLAGAHTITDIRLGDASLEVPANETKDVEVELREGFPGDLALDLITRQGRTLEPRVVLSVHQVDPENPDTLDGSDPLPVFHSVTTRTAPDENWIHFDLAGLIRQDSTTDSLRIPFRMRMRRKGDTDWRDLPEFHYQNVTQSETRLQVKIYWGSAFTDTLPTPPASIGFTMARKVVPAQDVNPIGTEFTADSYFSAGSGNDYLNSSNPDTTNIQNMVLNSESVEIYLNTDYSFAQNWVFANTDNSFTATQATITTATSHIIFTETNTDPILLSPSGLTIDGSIYYIIEIDVKRITDRTGGSFDGRVLYTTGGHGFSASYYKSFDDISLNERRTIRLDMSDLTAGGDDWITSTITQIRIDFDNATDGEFEIYSIKVRSATIDWPAGIYDIEIKRGETFRDTLFTDSTYDYNGDVLDFFGQIVAGTLPLTRAGLLDQVTLERLVNIWNDYPIKEENLALIGLKARDRRVARLSCLASGYVYDQPPGRGTHIKPTTSCAFSFNAAGSSSSDTEVLALIRPTAIADEDNPEAARIFLRGSSLSGSRNLYQFGFRYITSNEGGFNAVAIDKVVGGSVSNVQNARFSWALNKNFFLRFRAEGTSLKSKAWPASLPEPDAWTIELTDSDITTAGSVGITHSTSAVGNDGLFNWFSVGLNGATAPSPPSISSSLATDFSEIGLSSDLATDGWTLEFGTVTSGIEENDDLPYNGEQTEWSDFRSTSNPAPHFRDILIGSLNFNALPADIIDDTGLSEWRQRCAASGFHCDLAVEGLEIADLLRVVSGCGYGRLYRSEVWGVAQDRSRRGESPVQVFSPRNSKDLTWRKAFPRLPAGFRINFRDEDDDYTNDQVVVRRAGSEGSGSRLEQVTYDGLVSRSDVIQRARFDLAQSEARSTFYNFTVPAESLICRRGSLIALNHDVLRTHYGYARVSEVFVDEGYVTGVVLDAEVEIKNEPGIFETIDVLAVDDVLEIGLQSGIAIRKTTGDITVHAVSSDSGLTSEIAFETPVINVRTTGSPLDRNSVPEIDVGCLVVVGLVDDEYRRLIVQDITQQVDLQAQLTCVDETPEIFDQVFGAETELTDIGS